MLITAAAMARCRQALLAPAPAMAKAKATLMTTGKPLPNLNQPAAVMPMANPNQPAAAMTKKRRPASAARNRRAEPG